MILKTLGVGLSMWCLCYLLLKWPCENVFGQYITMKSKQWTLSGWTASTFSILIIVSMFSHISIQFIHLNFNKKYHMVQTDTCHRKILYTFVLWLIVAKAGNFMVTLTVIALNIYYTSIKLITLMCSAVYVNKHTCPYGGWWPNACIWLFWL